MPVTSSIERITPKLAAQLLKTNVRNRRVKAAHVSRIARDMIAGRFQFNGATIIVDEHGNVIDGQHRLLAVIESGVTIWAVVVRGVAAESADTIDSGIKRTAGDALTMLGHSDVTVAAAAIKFAAAYPTVYHSAAPAMTNAEVAEIAEQYRERIEHAVSVAGGLRLPPRWVSRSHVAAAILIAPDEADAIESFVRRARSAENLTQGSPELAFVKWNQSVAGSRHAARRGAYWTALVKALNASREGRELRLIKVGAEPPLLFGIEGSPFVQTEQLVIA